MQKANRWHRVCALAPRSTPDKSESANICVFYVKCHRWLTKFPLYKGLHRGRKKNVASFCKYSSIAGRLLDLVPASFSWKQRRTYNIRPISQSSQKPVSDRTHHVTQLLSQHTPPQVICRLSTKKGRVGNRIMDSTHAAADTRRPTPPHTVHTTDRREEIQSVKFSPSINRRTWQEYWSQQFVKEPKPLDLRAMPK